MLLLPNDKPFKTLDRYLDIETFLSLKDTFYYMFSNNLEHSKASWNAGSVEPDCSWKYLTETPYLYYALDKAKTDKYVELLKDKREGLAKYLQLKYNAFNPYTFMHINDYDTHEFKDFVPTEILKWMSKLPMTIDLVSILYNEHYVPLKYHRDFNFFPLEEGNKPEVPDTVQDVIWLRFDLNRNLYLYDFDVLGNIIDVVKFEGYSVNFNHYNWHVIS